jgi:hypothetical protein
VKSRAQFAQGLATFDLSHTDRAVALLWYYRYTQQYEERSASELATDLQDEGFPKPNVTRLASDLKRSPNTVRGKRLGTFQLDVRRIPKLDEQYLPILGAKNIKVTDAVLVSETVAGTRPYLEKLAHQINGAYEYEFFDACAVLCRRLMESLLIEVYLSKGRHHEIQQNGVFVPLEKLIAHITADRSITLGRGTNKIMEDVKRAGDTAAHDRTYITQQVDIDDWKSKYRKLISELLSVSGVKK